jgi:hypothetical protein
MRGSFRTLLGIKYFIVVSSNPVRYAILGSPNTFYSGSILEICPPGYSFSTPCSARENRILSDLLIESAIESEVRLSLYNDWNGEWKIWGDDSVS